MDLEVTAVRCAHDPSGLESLGRHLAVPDDQGEADLPGDLERDEWSEEQQGPQRDDLVLEGDAELRGDEVGRAGDPQCQEEDDARDTQRRTDRAVARPVEQVVLAPVASGTGLEEGPQDDGRQEATDDHLGHQYRERIRAAEARQLPTGRDEEEAERAHGHRGERQSDDVPLGPPGCGELGGESARGEP